MGLACKAGWALSAVLAAALGTGAYVFVVQGNTAPYEDGRTVVLLSKDERNRVLGEMRGLLEGSKGIIQAAVTGDMTSVETEARAIGMVAANGESPALIAKLPIEFMQMGMGAHKAMDDLADLAATSDDPLEVLGALGEAMEVCTGCHAGYRLGVEGQDDES